MKKEYDTQKNYYSFYVTRNFLPKLVIYDHEYLK